MKLNKVEQIELTTEEVRALDIIRRLGEHISGCAEDAEHRAKGEAIYQACAALEFVHHIDPDAEDSEKVILRRKDIQRVYDGTWGIDDLKAALPPECANLIEDACNEAREDGYGSGRIDGYNEGYLDRMEEEDE